MPTLTELKNQSGTNCFVSFFGKSTVSKERPEYELMQRVAQFVVECNAGVIHGGYTGGMMEAISSGADRTIRVRNFPRERNISIPHAEHDRTHGSRTPESICTDVAKDTCDRLRMVTSGDICVVCPLGGEGTDLEQTYVFAENTFAQKPQPLIFIQTETGTQWDAILDNKIRHLNHTETFITDYPWLYIVRSYEECAELLKKLIAERIH